MSTNLVVNSVSFAYPNTGDESWGAAASGWAAAVTTGMLQKAGGAFTLTADTNFGTNFGLISLYFTSVSTNPASTGVIRLADADSVSWRNHANSGDIALAKNTSNQLTWAGTAFLSASGVILPGGFPALTGDVTTTAGSTATSLVATSNSTLTTLSGLTTASSLATVGTIATGVWQGTTVAIAHGGTGLSSTSQNFVFAGPTSGSGAPLWRALVAADVPTLNQNTTGTAANITGTSNSTLTTLSALSLPGSQITGNIGGTASNVTGTSNSSLATLSALTSASSLTIIGTIGTGVWQGTAIGIAYGGTGVASVTTTPTASSWAGWDANLNLSASNLIDGFTSTATGAATTTLTVASTSQQYFTGSTTQTVKLPVVSTLALGMQYIIQNLSSGTVTIESSGANTIQAMASNTQLIVTCIAVTGTGTASWSWSYQAIQNSLGGGGTVTSVTFTGDGTVLSSTPSSAVTTSGTVTGSLLSQAKNTGLFGPSSGSNAAPTFRAMVAADIAPALTVPTLTKLIATGSTAGYLFTCSSANATVGATYTNNSITFTVLATIASGTQLFCSSSGAPTASGTLTKASGTGDATITFSANQPLATFSPAAGALYLKLRMIGPGGGGGGGNNGGVGSPGKISAFGANLIICNGGSGGGLNSGSAAGGPGGTATVASTSGLTCQSWTGGQGQSINAPISGVDLPGCMGAASPFAGGGMGGVYGNGAGQIGPTNSGAGGGGGGAGSGVTNSGGGGAGAYAEALISGAALVATFYYAVGTGGAGGSAGSTSGVGGSGADGIILVETHFQ